MTLRNLFFGPNNERPFAMFPELFTDADLGDVATWCSQAHVDFGVDTSFDGSGDCCRTSHILHVTVTYNGRDSECKFPANLKTIVLHTADHLVNIFLQTLMLGDTSDARILFGLHRSSQEYIQVYTLIGRGCCLKVAMCASMHRCLAHDGSTSSEGYANVVLAVHKHTGTHLSPFSDPLHERSVKLRFMYEDRRADRQLAFAMGLHNRLGAASPIETLDVGVVDIILRMMPPAERIEMTEAREIVRDVFESPPPDGNVPTSPSTNDSESSASI
jgi:hypothetical protein